MIKSIRLKNFQRHAALDVSFEEGINVIVGSSDAGKSAILRALKWCMTNLPRGAAFVKQGEKSTSVEISIDDVTLVRTKNGSENRYQLGETVFSAFGAEVPAEIQKILAVSSINFQDQHDSPYWFDLSPGEVSKRLNQIVDLQIIDKVTATSRQNLVEKRSILKISEESVVSQQSRVDDLEWVVGAEVEWLHLEKVAEDLEKKSARRRSLRDGINAITQAKSRIEAGSELMRALNPVGQSGKILISLNRRKLQVESRIKQATAALDLIEVGVGLSDSFSVLEKSVNRVASDLLRLTRIKKLIEEIERLRELASAIVAPPGPLSDLESMSLKIQKKLERLFSLQNSVTRIRKIEESIEIRNQDYQACQDKLEKVPVCETCGNPV